MKSQPRIIGLYIALLWVIAVGLVFMALPLRHTATWTDILVFCVMAVLSEIWFVNTGRDSGMSLSFTVHFAAALLFGPVVACVVAVTGILVADGFIKRRPLIRTAFNLAQMSIAVLAAGLIYQALGHAPLDLVHDAGALALAALAYLFINDALVSVVISLDGSSFLQEFIGSFRDLLLPYASMAPLGALAAYAYQASPWTILYFLPLIMVIYNGFRLFVTLQRETDHALVALADSIDKRDQYTYQHSQRVAALSGSIATSLGLPPREVDLIVAAARVHDLGKIATDNRVLFKRSSLTQDERRLIEAHPAEGGELAGKFSMFRQGRRFIRHHHERWDGSGYPDGLTAEMIPLGARVIAVADSYDAMTSDRPYRRALAHQVAMVEIERGAGQQFDPAVVRAFINSLDGQPAPAAHSSQAPAPAEASC